MPKFLENRTALDVINFVAGLMLLVSPWVFGFVTSAAAAWNAWLIGAAVLLISGAAILASTNMKSGATLGSVFGP